MWKKSSKIEWDKNDLSFLEDEVEKDEKTKENRYPLRKSSV